MFREVEKVIMNRHRILLSLISGLTLMSATLSLASEHYDVLIERGVEAKMRDGDGAPRGHLPAQGRREVSSSAPADALRQAWRAWILAFAPPRRDTS